MTAKGARTRALPSSAPRITRPAVLAQDGWAAWLLGTAAQCYLFLLVALTAIAVVPLAFGWGGSVVQTGSMRPGIQPGDVVLTTDLATSSPMPVGGVVQFRSAAPDGSDRLVLHRVVAPGDERGEWVTQGDANVDPDSAPLTRDLVTGQGRVLVQWVGLPSHWLAGGDLGRLLAWLVATAAAVWLAVWTWPRRRDTDDAGDPPRTGRRARGGSVALGVAALLVAGATFVPTDSAYAAFSARTAMTANTFRVATWPTLTLGRASSYAVLASTRVANTALLGLGSAVNGNVGVTPGTTVSGFWPWDVTGSTDRNTSGAQAARADAITLYDAARARSATATPAAVLSGTLVPGVYRRAGAVTVQGALTLDARGDPSAVFVVQGSALTFAQGANVVLANGAAADRVFFVSTSTAAVNDNARVRGVLLASGDITLNRASTLGGRAVSVSGAVSLLSATVTQP